jgi:O-antigen ligase
VENTVKRRSILLAGIGYLFAALLHIPDNIFRYAFDKNAPVQLLTLISLAVAFLVAIIARPSRFFFDKKLTYAALFLILAATISLVQSGNLVGALYGDSGRFVGLLSLIALFIVSTFHGQFSLRSFRELLWLYLLSIELVSILGIAQHFDFLEFPGAHGVASTFGNTDFYAAYLGTAFPLLVFLALKAGPRMRLLLGAVALLNIFALYCAGPLQAWVDLAIAVVGVAIYRVRRYIKRFEWTLNARTFIGTFAIIIWAEFIFLMPFLGSFVPVLGNDIQVKIRGNFWIAGIRQFFDHPVFGVGPDQYGNYYEQYRTIDDLKAYPLILSNDAHASSVQTLATLGIVGTLGFIILLAFLVRALLILWDTRKIDRASTYFLGLFLFIYLTNSFISPITLSHKYIFWAVAGFIIGQVYRTRKQSQAPRLLIRTSAVVLVIALLPAAFVFAQGQLNYLKSVDKYGRDNNAIIDYTPSPVLPCNMYFDAEFTILEKQGNAAVLDLANKELQGNTRCVAANIVIAKYLLNIDDMASMKSYAYNLHEIAPGRGKSIELAMYYANRTQDATLFASVQKVMSELKLVYIPGAQG